MLGSESMGTRCDLSLPSPAKSSNATTVDVASSDSIDEEIFNVAGVDSRRNQPCVVLVQLGVASVGASPPCCSTFPSCSLIV